MNRSTHRLAIDGLAIDVEHVTPHRTIHGARGPRVYVRIRPEAAEPGRDAGPRTCLTLTPAAAERFGLLLQQSALLAQLSRLGGAA